MQPQPTPLDHRVSDADAVILGAGPAGAAAAIECAKAGLRVVVLERQPFPRCAVGETLHPGAIPLLKRLGVADQVESAGFLRHAGNFVTWGEAEQFMPFGEDESGPWLGVQAWRATFDSILLDHARELGVVVCQPVKLKRVLIERGSLVGVTSTQGTTTTRYVVDATGRQHWLLRQMNMEMSFHGPRRLAWYGYAEGPAREYSTTPSLRADRTGWTWVAQVRPGLCQWTRLNWNNQRPLASWLPNELQGMRKCGSTRGADVTWRIAKTPAGPNHFLVGDAACVLDPASSHGVLKAIMSGIMVGYLISQVRSGHITKADAAHCYCQQLNSWFQHDIAALTKLYSRVEPSFLGRGMTKMD